MRNARDIAILIHKDVSIFVVSTKLIIFFSQLLFQEDITEKCRSHLMTHFAWDRKIKKNSFRFLKIEKISFNHLPKCVMDLCWLFLGHFWSFEASCISFKGSNINWREPLIKLSNQVKSLINTKQFGFYSYSTLSLLADEKLLSSAFFILQLQLSWIWQRNRTHLLKLITFLRKGVCVNGVTCLKDILLTCL